MSEPRPALESAYDPEAFRALAHQVADRLAEHLAAARRREGPVLPPASPSEALAAWPDHFPEGPGADPLDLLQQVILASNHLHHPRYVGHQVTAPLPWSALLDFAGAFLNNGSAIFEMGPASTVMERAVARLFARRAGFDPERADGFLTHGGSAGNLTALLAARQRAAGWDVWEEGMEPGKLCILVSEQAHYSVRRSAQVMGLGGRAVHPVACDGAFRMKPAALAEALRMAQAEGLTVMAVVASAGATATGAFDPLESVADCCAEAGVWLHVDAAHGGGLLLSDRLRPQFRGLERADSLVIDAHKMMLAPALATLVLFREGDRSFETFSQSASYLFGADPRETWFDLAQRTLECTKRSLGLQVYASLQVMGTAFFGAYAERMVDLTRSFADHLKARPHWELATEPDCNILCFRFAPPAATDADTHQEKIRAALLQEGSFYLVKTRLAGKTWLRTTVINPGTTEADLQALAERIEAEPC